jgi:hypothetical protein
VLAQRTSISWNIPRAELAALLEKRSFPAALHSAPVYLAGTGVQLCAQLECENGDAPYQLGVYTTTCSFQVAHTTTVPSAGLLSCTIHTQRVSTGHTQPLNVYRAAGTLGSSHGWGLQKVYEISTPSDLEPHLVDGCLKLRLKIEPVLQTSCPE